MHCLLCNLLPATLKNILKLTSYEKHMAPLFEKLLLVEVSGSNLCTLWEFHASKIAGWQRASVLV